MKHMNVATMIAAGLLALGAMAPVRAQAPMVIGFVDIQKVFGATDAKKEATDKVSALQRSLEDRGAALKDAAMLPSQTWQQYKTLLEKDKPTAQDTSSLAGIKDQVAKLDAEIKTLQQTPQLTDAQKARYNELNGNITANTGNLQSLANDYQTQLDKLQEDLTNNIIKDIQTASLQVAKSRNIPVVLDKQVVVAGGVDLTDDVTKQVNATHKPS